VRDGRDLIDVGYEIKHRVKNHVGSYVTVNVGIGTNRFWAKTAAGLNKPDGLDVMDAGNAMKVYERLKLTDLTGINWRYEARLNQHGIFTPLQLFAAGEPKLQKQVFKSIVGRQWYARLRGWEVDAVIWGRKSIGHNYAIGQKTAEREEIAKLLMKLCHKVGRRMRGQGFSARGIHLSISFANGEWWSKSYDTRTLMYATSDIYYHGRQLLNKITIPDVATNISVSVYHLTPNEPAQLSLFRGGALDSRAVTDAADAINDRYGNYTLVPAVMAGMDKVIIDRIAFGSVKDYLD
jgi:DNA polymerase-4